MKRMYDLIIPLGCNCATAMQLKMLHLRRYSSPFDWLLANDDDALAQACTLLETHFREFLIRENIVECPEFSDARHTAYYDKGSARCFLHDFIKSPPLSDFEDVKEKYARRIRRLYKFINSSDSILFCFSALSPAQATEEQILQAYERLKALFGEKKSVDLFIMRYSSNAVCEYWLDGNKHIFISEDVRSYDYELSCCHFAPISRFLLSVKLSSKVVSCLDERVSSFVANIYYKINKHTSKWLLKKGIQPPITFN